METVLYIDSEKDYKKLLQGYYDNSYSSSWLKGYVACLYASMMIDDAKRYELNCFIEELEQEKLSKGGKGK